MEDGGTSNSVMSSLWGLFYKMFGENHFHMNVIGRFVTEQLKHAKINTKTPVSIVNT